MSAEDALRRRYARPSAASRVEERLKHPSSLASETGRLADLVGMSLGLIIFAGWCALDAVVIAAYVGLHRWSSARRPVGPTERPQLAAVTIEG